MREITTVPNTPYKQLKRLIWVYFWLLILEGGLRKWLLPGLATPLLLIRDPLAIYLLFKCWRYRLIPPSPYLISVVAIGLIGIYTAFFLGHQNLPVALYGARIFLVQFPVIFAIAQVFKKEDVIQIGKVTLKLAIPMTMLIASQFYSPQSAWVNRGIGGTGGGGFDGAMGYLRPPGTFSFTSGTTLFYSLVSVFVFYFWLNPKKINLGLLIAATASLLAAIPLSISRSLLMQVAISAFFAVLAAARKPEIAGKLAGALVGLCLAFAVLSQTGFFNTAGRVLTSRFKTANQQEGGLSNALVDRYLGGLLEAVNQSADQPLFGYGLGMGTNAGSMLLTGKQTFLISEGEWGRLIGELGPIMGLILIIIRVALTGGMTISSYRRMTGGDFLPWMLLAFGLLILPQGNWSQPTSLGFCVLIAGLILAACRPTKGETAPRLDR